ncbi:MAG: histidine phosphatase family protein [Desulfocapsaceae bacterium]|nr:histidine phosphatase family protein [Desulfocapsaceae bacterium]
MYILKTLIMLAIVSWSFVSVSAASEEELITQNLQDGNHFIILRHALAPGTGDPSNFNLTDCTTQRNLSAEGRDQAERIGAFLQSHGIDDARVFTSQWCRCLDTAKLLGFGEVNELPALNSFFRDFEKEESQTRELRDWLGEQDIGAAPLVLVSHQVNITALTGVFPQSGEMVVVERKEDGQLQVAGTIVIR